MKTVLIKLFSMSCIVNIISSAQIDGGRCAGDKALLLIVFCFFALFYYLIILEAGEGQWIYLCR